MYTELGFHTAMFCRSWSTSCLRGYLSPLRIFFFYIGLFLFCFFSVFFSHEQQKLEDIGGGILMHGYAVEITVEDEPTLYPLICRRNSGRQGPYYGLTKQHRLVSLSRLNPGERLYGQGCDCVNGGRDNCSGWQLHRRLLGST
jgi:hypothetical protein